jgi:hypothetical protein
MSRQPDYWVEYGYHPEGPKRSNQVEFNIPENVFPFTKSESRSRTGLPGWGMNIVKEVGQKLPGLMDDFTGSIENMAQAPGLLDQWVSQGGTSYLAGLQPFQNYLRQPLEKLGSKGMFDSTLTRDAMTNIGGLLSDDFTKNQAELGQKAIELKYENLGDMAQLRGMAADLVRGILGLGSVTTSSSETYSENKWTQYSDLLKLLTS